MEQDRRDVFRGIGMIGATALAFVSASKRARADAPGEQQNPLLGLWDMTIPIEGAPTLNYKYAISEGAYVCTGNYDGTATPFGNKYSPTMGTYAQTGPNTYRLRERSWAMDADGNPAGSSDFTGSATVAWDRKTFSGSGTYTQYDLNGNVVFAQTINYTATKFPA